MTRKLFTVAVIVLLSSKAKCVNVNSGIKCDPDIPSRLPRLEENASTAARAEDSDVIAHCAQGEYLEGRVCSPCPDGTFRTRQMAQADERSRCVNCLKPKEHEIEIGVCTKTRDTVMLCQDGYYRARDPTAPCRSECIVCDTCGVGRNMFKDFQRRHCSGYSSTVCCESENMVAVNETCVPATSPPPAPPTAARASSGASFVVSATSSSDWLRAITSSPGSDTTSSQDWRNTAVRHQLRNSAMRNVHQLMCYCLTVNLIQFLCII